MAIVLGANNYGKAETRLVRVRRDSPEHEIADLKVTVTLAGDFTDTHLTGDNAKVLPTDSQKNAVYAFARSAGVDQIETFAAVLARYFVDSQPSIQIARVSVEEYGWRRLGPHSFARAGEDVRTAVVTYDGTTTWVVSGIQDLVLFNSTGSQFHGFRRDRYTTLAETTDRVLATAVAASWRHTGPDTDWSASFAGARDALIGAFTRTHSLSLQQTLYAMGRAVLSDRPEVAEVRLSLPNRHHFLVDLTPFGLTNPGEVFYAADRPYGLIEGTVTRDEAPAPGLAWALPG